MGKSTQSTKPTRRRSGGEGSVYEADGRWRGAITWTDHDGRRHRRVVSGPTAQEARDRLDRLRAELRLGTLRPAGRDLTLERYLTAWVERDAARVRPSTAKAREMHVRVYLVPALGRIPVTRLSPADVGRALRGFQERGRPAPTPEPGAPKRRGRQRVNPVSALTARHIRATLRLALADAVRDGLVGRNAAADARPPRVETQPVDYLDAGALRQLLEGSADDELGPIIAVAAATGLRLGELLGLSWDDVDLEAGTLSVRRSMALTADGSHALAAPKSARSRRTIPLPGAARDALVTERARQTDRRGRAGAAWQDAAGLVFTDVMGRPLRPEGVSARFQRVREAAGVRRVRFHDLRHSAATMLLAEGVPVAVISDWLGHAGVAVTMAHYAAIVPELRRDAAAAMDRALSSSTSGDRPKLRALPGGRAS